MGRIGLNVGVACYCGGLVTAIAGAAVALDAVDRPLPIVVAGGAIAGLVAAVVLPPRLDPAFARTADDRVLLIAMFAGLGAGLGPFGVLFLDEAFAVDTVLVGGGLATLLGVALIWQSSQHVWVDRLFADSDRVVDLGESPGHRWERVAGVVILLSVAVLLVMAVRERSYTTFVAIFYLGTMAVPSQLWPGREAVLAEGLLQHQHGAATLSEWDTFESYSIEDDILTLHQRRSETTVDLSRAEDPERARSIVASNLPAA